MANHRSADIRNFAIVAHASSGKTVLSEALLTGTGKTKSLHSTSPLKKQPP
jgi:translation elongation factor EF-G